MYSSGELFLRSREGYFGVYYNKHDKYTRVHIQFITKVYAPFCYLHAITNPYMTLKEDPHTSTPCLTRSVHMLLMAWKLIGDDITITRQLWRDCVNGGI